MTTVMKHTQGPWHRSTIGSHHACRLIFGPDGLLVADAGRIQRRTDEEMDANADLIAAAPELLAMLKWAVNGGCTWTIGSHLVDAEKLIAQAEGGAQ